MVHIPNFWGKKNLSRKCSFAKHNFIWVSSTMPKFTKHLPTQFQENTHTEERTDKRRERSYFKSPSGYHQGFNNKKLKWGKINIDIILKLLKLDLRLSLLSEKFVLSFFTSYWYFTMFKLLFTLFIRKLYAYNAFS